MNYKKQLYEYYKSYLTPTRLALIEENAKCRTNKIVAVVEDIYNEHNAGAIMRTCDCLGIHNVHVIENIYDHYTSDAIAKGSSKWLNLTIHNNEGENNSLAAIKKLKNSGYKVLGTSPHQPSTLISEYSFKEPVAIFFGAEKKGLSKAVLSATDENIRLPIYGFSESYNVSVSAALILTEFIKQLKIALGADWQLTEEEALDLKLEWAEKSLRNPNSLKKHFDSLQKKKGG